MCGSFTFDGNAHTVPGSKCRPCSWGASSLESYSTCSPRQMPRKGTPRWMAARRGARIVLKYALDPMMRRPPIESAQVDVGLRSLRKALEKILHQFHLEIADAFGRDLRLHDAVRSSAKVHGGGSECFVHGHQEIARAQNATLRAEGFLH